jgi:protein gp37
VGERRRVFTGSMCDIFDNRAPEAWRADLWRLIAATPDLTWMLLTKRPQNIAGMLPPDWGAGWRNVWLGCTAENQAEAARRIPALLEIPAAAVRFLSIEPMLEAVDLGRWLGPGFRRARSGQEISPARACDSPPGRAQVGGCTFFARPGRLS